MNNRTLAFSSALLILAASCFFVSCRRQRTNDEDENRSARNIQVAVKTADVVERDAILTVHAFGKTDALKKEKIIAPVAGKITSLRVFEGTQVRKGDILLLIQSKESYTAIVGAETMLRTASSPAQREEAERALALAKQSEKTVNITARFNGYVSTRTIGEGELVAENAELLTIIDLSTIIFLADVQLRDLPSIHPGQRASINVQSLPGTDLPAVVAAISPQSDIQSQTVKVRLQFALPEKSHQTILRTDMMGEARIIVGLRKHALFVPKAALLRNDEENTYSVITITPESLARSIPVTVGVETDSTAEVTSPLLHAGMTVITSGNYSLSDSTRVTISPTSGE